jgi:acyl-CoA synthetase (NDP forming)
VDLEVINKLLRPKSIAVVGASTQPGKIGYTVLNNLIRDGYTGKIFPINPQAEEILGVKCYASVLDVPESIDAAVIVVPAKFCAQVIDECGKKGVKGLIVITSGFSEVGRKDLEIQLVDIARQYGMRILGPNIVGTLSNSDKLNASFAPFLPLTGTASLVDRYRCFLFQPRGWL